MSDVNAIPTSEPRKIGALKILSGPADLLRLLPRATMDFEVAARRTTLEWTRAGAGVARIEGSQIESVQQHGQAFVVALKPTSFGTKVLTFAAPSEADAEAWVQAIEAIKASAAVVRPDAREPDVSTGDNAAAIKLTYTLRDTPITKEFALLIIACDPRNLINICDYSPEEIAIFNELVNFTFHTTLLKVKVNPKTWRQHGVIFAPGPLDLMDGSVYGFRNESAKQFTLDTAKEMEYNLVTVYQLLGVTDQKWTPDQFQKVLKEQLKTLDWWPFGEDYEIRESVTTPYFNHFRANALKTGRPWELLGRQGSRSTLLVHASTCFESALHCWDYARLMLDTAPGASQALPPDKNAPIAILGAGVSGLLFATRLTQLGYTNIQILETCDQYGGKTHTFIEHGPYPPNSQEPTVCELGTCYLSPAYDSFVQDLSTPVNFLEGNEQIDFTLGRPTFRGIATQGQLPSDFCAPSVMNFADYVVWKAAAEMGKPKDELSLVEAQLALAVDLALYGLLHPLYVGWQPPMPTTKPDSLEGPFGQQTFLDFLKAQGLTALVGSLQYGYEVQGYGPLTEIPAYYGLLWITPPTTWTILLDALPPWIADILGLKQESVVTAWTKGWGDVWRQIVEKQDLKITYNAQTTLVERS
jgi:NAD(P)-binding Rossmann-like domain